MIGATDHKTTAEGIKDAPGRTMNEAELQETIAAVISSNAHSIAGLIVDHIFRDMVADGMRLMEQGLIPEHGSTGHATFDAAAMTDYLEAAGLQDLSTTSTVEIGGARVKKDFFTVMGDCLDPDDGCGLYLLWLLPEIMKAIQENGAAGFRAQIPRYCICSDAMG